MGFFKELPDLPARRCSQRSPRMGPSEAELPVGVPLALTAARNDRAAIGLGPIQAYSDGFVVFANLVVRSVEPDRIGHFHPFSRHHGQDKDSVVRLALVFSDGTAAEAVRALDDDAPRTLLPQGGGGSPWHWSTSFWSHPLPPPGVIEVVCAWPAYGVAETRVTFDAQPILEASARVAQLWPEPGDATRHSSSSVIGFSASD